MESSGQDDTPKNRINISNTQLPIPLIKAGLKHAEHVHVIYCYESFSNAQMI
jgi:hypothetical protein